LELALVHYLKMFNYSSLLFAFLFEILCVARAVEQVATINNDEISKDKKN
jgi:hypothetical protein